MVADVAPQTQQAWNLAANSGNVGQDAQNAAQAGYLNTMSQTPQNVQAGQLSNTNLQPYMNPYTQSVINATLPIMQQNLGLQQNQQQNAANSAGAFGGSRQGIQQGVTQAQGAQNMAQMAQQLNQANFTQAQARRAGRHRQHAEGPAGQPVGGAAAGRACQPGGAGPGHARQSADAEQHRQLRHVDLGRRLRAAAGQNQINAQLAKFNQAFQYPQQQLGMMESSLGMTPYDTGSSGTSSSTTTQTQSNPAAMALGGLQTLGGLFSAPAGGTSAASGIMSMFSDRRLKTDIQKIGTHSTGLPIYAYRYKGDPKAYPKVAGPMAEDVMKIAPMRCGR